MNLPKHFLIFLYWWAFLAPKKIIIVAKRVLVMFNNQFSFSINLRLFFTPLYGDYTFIGRIIGLVTRLVFTLFGFVLMAFLFLIFSLLPLVWLVLPFVLAFFIKWWVLAFYFAVFLLREYARRDTPEKKTSQVDISKSVEYLKAFRPSTAKFLKKIDEAEKNALIQFVGEPGIQYIFKKAELLNADFLNKLTEAKLSEPSNIGLSAFNFAFKHKCRYVELEHLLLAVLQAVPKADSLLSVFSSEFSIVEETVSWIVSEREALSKVFVWQDDYDRTLFGGIGKGLTGRVTPNLDAVSEDFTRMVRNGSIKPVIGRDREIKEIAKLLGSSKVNVLIVGEPGSGKTTIVKGIAYQVIAGTEYESLKNKRIVSLSPGVLIAGTRTAGDVGEKLAKIMKEVEFSKDIILFIDEIHNLVTSDTEGDSEISGAFSALEPYLSTGVVQFIGATSIANYRKYLEPNGSFSRLFEMVEIPQASKEATLEILKEETALFERDFKIVISYPALKKVIELSDKLIHERVLPDKALDILNRTATVVADSTRFLTAEDIALKISELTHVPVSSITQDESQKLLNIESEMKKRVIGQDEAIDQIGSALKRARVGIRNESKPIASFLFVGTTGIGKTETAKALARTYFGDVKTMIRLDMSEYQQLESMDKLIGNPDGSTKGILTEAVRTAPFSLVLLDEIEKASSNVLLTFLQVLDDGRLTDSSGRVVDFTNAIIIATSNVGTRSIQEVSQKGGSFDDITYVAMTEVRNKFAPEFLNRFSGIIVFKPLNLENVRKIADIMLKGVRELADNKGVNLSFKPELIEELVKRGFSPQWGARPLARVIENSVESYLAVKLLSNEIKRGSEVNLGLEVFSASDKMQA